MKQLARELFAHLRKDLALEWRTRDAINGMLLFSLLVVVVFSFAFDPTAAQSRAIAGGILWIALLFSVIIALNQAWVRETRNNVLDAVRMTPAAPSMIFLGKTIANFLFVSVMELVMAPLFVVFYNLRAAGQAGLLWLALPLGTWALVVNGTFFAALSLRTRNRELMLPLLLLPISIPALLGAVESTAAILTGESSPALWLQTLAVYDIVFTTLGLLLFGVILSAE